MVSDEMYRELFNLVKGVVGQVKNQQVAVESLWRNQQTGFVIMRKIAGMPEEEPAAAEPVIDTETIAKMQAGLAELEKMFPQKDGEKEE